MHKKSNHGILFQDIGLLAFLIVVFVTMAVVWAGGSDLLPENCVLMFFTVVAIMLITFSADIAAFVITGSLIICYTAYKIFSLYTNGTEISMLAYAWLLLPLAAIGSMKLFCIGRVRLETENSVLREQVEELVMVDPLTGLYNLRSFYHDIPMQVSYTKRNKMPLTLMIIHLRYAQELRRVLPGNHYDEVKQRLSQIVQDSIRSEDRVYSIDNDGGLATILTCDDVGSVHVRNRIRAKSSEKGAFDKIVDTSIKVDVQIAFLQYHQEMGTDMIHFKSLVENELQYDV